MEGTICENDREEQILKRLVFRVGDAANLPLGLLIPFLVFYFCFVFNI